MLQRRQAEAKQAVRKHIDEVTFQVGKDSRDMLRHTQRQLRDHFSALAEEVSTSIAELGAGRAERRQDHDVGAASSRIRDLKAELARIDALAEPGPASWSTTAGPSAGGPPGDVPSPPLGSVVRVLLRRTIDTYRDSPQAVGWLQHNLARFDEPLRVAIAGKVKAGKSTLLNALVGEEIAPTDAGECTRDRHLVPGRATSPKVTMFPRGAAAAAAGDPPRPAARCAFDLQGTPVEQVDKLEVQWPSQSLRTQTLIDTPGIASLSSDTSARAGAFLAPGGRADARPTP